MDLFFGSLLFAKRSSSSVTIHAFGLVFGSEQMTMVGLPTVELHQAYINVMGFNIANLGIVQSTLKVSLLEMKRAGRGDAI